eukprot:Skav204025  [mRNA]  locus=scaffold229:194736:195863:+ [translate_table: standard]
MRVQQGAVLVLLAVLVSFAGIFAFVSIYWNPVDKVSKDVQLHQEPPAPRLALFIAGTLRRFNSNADTHLVAPLTRANWTVDVFLSLFDGPSKGWRKTTNAFQQDPQFEGLNRSGIQNLLERRFSIPGSRLVVNKIFDEYHESSEDMAFVRRNQFWRNKRGAGDGRIARSNFILLLKELESLWYLALSQEYLRGPYSYVMILRDDAYWFQPFNLSQLLDNGGVERTRGNKGHLYSLMCETLDVQDPLGIIDYVFLLDRPAAETFGRSYSRLAHPAHFGKEWDTMYEDDEVGDMSERFYLILANFTEIHVTDVPAYLMPMQRVGRMDGKGLCLHKYCDSHLKSKSIPWLNPDLPLCKPKKTTFVFRFWKNLGEDAPE